MGEYGYMKLNQELWDDEMEYNKRLTKMLHRNAKGEFKKLLIKIFGEDYIKRLKNGN